MNSVDRETLEKWQKVLDEAVMVYMKQISGVPMSPEDHVARFLIHSAVLVQELEFDTEAMMKLVEFSKKCRLTVGGKYSIN